MACSICYTSLWAKTSLFFVVDVGVQRQEWHVTKLLEKKVRRTRRAVKSANAVKFATKKCLQNRFVALVSIRLKKWQIEKNKELYIALLSFIWFNDC